MKKIILLVLLAGVALTSCKSKKRYSDQLRTKNVQNERRNSNKDVSKNSDNADLPAEPSNKMP